MNSRIKFAVIAFILIGLLALIELFYPKPVVWQITLSSDDTIPFGLSVLKESLPEIFPEQDIIHTRETFYLMDSSHYAEGYISISQSFDQGKEDFEALSYRVSEGGHVLLSAYGFSESMQDSLEFTIKDDILDDLYPDQMIPEEDSSYLEMIVPNLADAFIYRRMDAPYNFEMENPDDWEILMVNEENKPVSIARNMGKGQLILNCTPLIFSNYYMLYTTNSKSVAALLSFIPESTLHWTEFYSRGRDEPQTPLRYVLETPPLRWAYYLTISAVLAFVLFEAKRKQRAVSIIKPPRNDSLDFIQTVGNLYYENADHKNIVDKKIQYLLEYIRSHYHLQTNSIDNSEFLLQLANKSGKPLVNVEGLFTMIGILQKKQEIHAQELQILNNKIEAFLKI